MQFEWDNEKAERNLRKHGISFEGATAAFLDPFGFEEPNDYRGDEDRWQLVAIGSNRVIFVVYTYRAAIIRLISARKAEPHERARYRQNRLLHP